MLDFLTSTTNTIDTPTAAATVLTAFILGLMISLTYMATGEKESYSQSFCYTLIIVPIVSAIIIYLVGSNIAVAFSVGGAFSLTKFRSEPGSPKNIAYIFFTVAAGLACGVHCYLYAFAFTVMLCLIMLVFTKINFGHKNISSKRLKILIPESLDFSDTFNEILNKYTLKYEILKVSTLDLGSIYELEYNIVLKNNINYKEFIDELRVRNGNLSITLTGNDYKLSKAVF